MDTRLKEFGVELTDTRGLSGSVLKLLNHPADKIEDLLGVPIRDRFLEKYSDSVGVKFQGFYFDIYCKFNSPRLGLRSKVSSRLAGAFDIDEEHKSAGLLLADFINNLVVEDKP